MKTTNYEISKQLAEAEFKAETDFYWAKWNQQAKLNSTRITSTSS